MTDDQMKALREAVEDGHLRVSVSVGVGSPVATIGTKELLELVHAGQRVLSSPRVEEVRREALEEAAKVADEAQATAREEIAEEKAEEGYDPYAFGSGFLSGELTAAVNIAKAIRALKEKNNG